MTESEYKNMVDLFLKNDSTEVFGNFTPAHAGYITAKFIESAQSSIELLSGHFPNGFYGNVKEELKKAAERLAKCGGKIRIITADGIESEDLLDMANDPKLKNNFEYISATYSGKESLNHFLIVDGKRYRLEAPHEKSDDTPMRVQAEVCCNGKEKAQKLRGYFDIIWKILTTDK